MFLLPEIPGSVIVRESKTELKSVLFLLIKNMFFFCVDTITGAAEV